MSESSHSGLTPVEMQAHRDFWLSRMILSLVVMLILTGLTALMITQLKYLHVVVVLAGLLVIATGVFAFSIPFRTPQASWGWLVTITILRVSIAGVISFLLLGALFVLLVLSICFGGITKVH